jgi:mono/diheme cytochrome c family protein
MRRAAFFTFLLLLLGVFGWRWLAHLPPRVTETDTSVAAAGVTLNSQTLTLPADQIAFPAGSGNAVLVTNCTGCHSPEMILNQPQLAGDKWQATIDKMRKAYHAPIAPGDDAKIIAALMALPPQRAAPAK